MNMLQWIIIFNSSVSALYLNNHFYFLFSAEIKKQLLESKLARKRRSYKGIGQKLSIYLRYLHHEMGLGIVEIHRRYPQYPKTCLYRHMKQELEVDEGDSQHKSSWWPRKATVRDCWQIIRTLQSLRRSVGMFSFTNIQEAVDMKATNLMEMVS